MRPGVPASPFGPTGPTGPTGPLNLRGRFWWRLLGQLAWLGVWSAWVGVPYWHRFLLVLAVSLARVAPAALLTTFVTSLAGVGTFALLAASGAPAAAPERVLGLALGCGGAWWARISVPERSLMCGSPFCVADSGSWLWPSGPRMPGPSWGDYSPGGPLRGQTAEETCRVTCSSRTLGRTVPASG